MGNEFSLTQFLLQSDLPERGTEDHLRKWLEYKAGKGPRDPDSTETDFYALLWGREIKTSLSVDTKPFPVVIQGDWMCSVWTTLRRGLGIAHQRELKNAGIDVDKNGCPTVGSCIKNNNRPENNDKLLENLEMFTLLHHDVVYDFIYNAYTRANLMIVPKGLNTARGGHPTDDYWDEALKYLLEPLTVDAKYQPLREHAEFFQRLLGHFNISGLLLEDWINDDQEPIMLPGKKPGTEQEWLELVGSMNSRIESRRAQMEEYLSSLDKQ